MQDFYRCAPGYEARANQVANKACYKLVKDMHYEARVQAHVRYIADYEKRSIKKGPAREIYLRPDQYARVNQEHLYSFCVNLRFQYDIHLITCR